MPIIKLREVLNNCLLNYQGQITFPSGDPQSLHESFFYPEPSVLCEVFSHLEVNAHRMIYYVQAISSRPSDKNQAASTELVVSTGDIFIDLSLFLIYAKQFFQEIGYSGTFFLQVGLRMVGGRKLKNPLDHINGPSDIPILDESFSFWQQISPNALFQGSENVLKQIFTEICFSLGWKDSYAVEDCLFNNFLKCRESRVGSIRPKKSTK